MLRPLGDGSLGYPGAAEGYGSLALQSSYIDVANIELRMQWVPFTDDTSAAGRVAQPHLHRQQTPKKQSKRAETKAKQRVAADLSLSALGACNIYSAKVAESYRSAFGSDVFGGAKATGPPARTESKAAEKGQASIKMGKALESPGTSFSAVSQKYMMEVEGLYHKLDQLSEHYDLDPFLGSRGHVDGCTDQKGQGACLDAPLVRQVCPIYGVNVDTEVAAVYRHRQFRKSANSVQAYFELDTDADLRDAPDGIRIEGGVVYETPSALQQSLANNWTKQCRSGDGVVPYSSLQKPLQWIREGSHVDVVEVNGAGHYDILEHPTLLQKLISKTMSGPALEFTLTVLLAKDLDHQTKTVSEEDDLDIGGSSSSAAEAGAAASLYVEILFDGQRFTTPLSDTEKHSGNPVWNGGNVFTFGLSDAFVQTATELAAEQMKAQLSHEHHRFPASPHRMLDVSPPSAWRESHSPEQSSQITMQANVYSADPYRKDVCLGTVELYLPALLQRNQGLRNMVLLPLQKFHSGFSRSNSPIGNMNGVSTPERTSERAGGDLHLVRHGCLFCFDELLTHSCLFFSFTHLGLYYPPTQILSVLVGGSSVDNGRSKDAPQTVSTQQHEFRHVSCSVAARWETEPFALFLADFAEDLLQLCSGALRVVGVACIEGGRRPTNGPCTFGGKNSAAQQAARTLGRAARLWARHTARRTARQTARQKYKQEAPSRRRTCAKAAPRVTCPTKAR
jgi:hypothetical protein